MSTLCRGFLDAFLDDFRAAIGVTPDSVIVDDLFAVRMALLIDERIRFD
jgi:hypothetical protein